MFTLLRAQLSLAAVIAILGFVADNQRALAHDMNRASHERALSSAGYVHSERVFDGAVDETVYPDDTPILVDVRAYGMHIEQPMLVITSDAVIDADVLEDVGDELAERMRHAPSSMSGLADDFTGWEDIDESWSCIAHHGSLVTI